MNRSLLLLLMLQCQASVGLAEDEQRQLKKIRVIGRDPRPSQLPLGLCRGDCDSDKDCDEGLVCFQRTRFTAVPGCSGGRSDGSYSDYCVRKSNFGIHNGPTKAQPTKTPPAELFPNLRIVGDNIFDHSNPLGHCEGDCDDDRKDCQGSLVCMQRRDRNQPVFGCQGGLADSSRIDYCIHPDSVIPPNERPELPYVSPHPFRLKLYWEEGYKWQEESRERKWCMMHNYPGPKCWHGPKRARCKNDAIYISKCQKDDERQEFVFFFLTGGEEILIVASDHCFQREGRNIRLRRCNPASPLQRWYAPKGNMHGYRFEISQKSYSRRCITQDHHPKEGEIVELQSCSQTRSAGHQSSYWNVY